MPRKPRIDTERPQRVINFIEKLKVPEGRLVGKPIKLIPSQVDFIRKVYGPVGDDGLRLVKEAIMSEPRKNGKSTLTAALVLAHLCGPECLQENAQLYSAAQDKEQAALVFKLATHMAYSHPKVAASLKILPSVKKMVHLDSGSEYKALSAESKTKYGFSTTFCIFDELAQAGADRRLYDALRTSSGAQEEFLFLIISTQAADDSAVLSELIDYALEGEDETVAITMYSAPDDAEIFDEAVWYECNPALGIYRDLKEMREMAARAKRLPSYEGMFRNLYLNQRIAAEGTIIQPSLWKRQAIMPSFNPHLEWYGGLDLSTRLDLTAFVMTSYNDDSSINVLCWFWTPKATLEVRAFRDRAPYLKWAQLGYLKTVPGTDVDYDHVALEIGKISRVFNLIDINFDRYRIEDFNRSCDRMGVSLPLSECGQGYVDMNPCVEAFELAATACRLKHGGNPVLTQSIMNTVLDTDPAGNRKPTKKRARGRIDGFTALAMSLRALGVEEVSVYDDPDYEVMVVG